MKSESHSSRKSGVGRGPLRGGMGHMPMEWMDPMSWRLPSGQALAEFALQAGFLAPLILSAPKMKRKMRSVESVVPPTGSDLPGEVGSSSDFKEISFTKTGLKDGSAKDRDYNGKSFSDTVFNERGFNDTVFNDVGFNDVGFNDVGFSDVGFDDVSFNDVGFSDPGFRGIR